MEVTFLFKSLFLDEAKLKGSYEVHNYWNILVKIELVRKTAARIKYFLK